MPKLPELQNHEIDKGGYDETCSVDGDIGTYMPNFTFEKGEHMTVFKKSKHSASKSSKLKVLIRTRKRASLKDEVGDDIAGLLERVKFGSDSILLQFWKATVKLGGRTVLETAGQPFALDHFYKGLWRYRRRCHDHSYDLFYTFDKKGSRLGPPSRVFKNGIPEFCPNIEAYSTDEFPLRDFAVHECGIQGYWALPLFLRDKMHCVIGVLEVVAFKYTDIFVEHQVNPVIQALNKVRKDALCAQVDIQQVLEFVREVHQLLLIQAWVPCLCDDRQKQVPYVGLSSVGAWRPAELFCEMRSCDRNVKDTSQLSISDCPFVHLTRIAGFTAVAHGFSRLNVAFGLKEGDEFCVKFSESYDRDRVKIPEGVYTNGEVQLTLDVLRQYFGRKLADVAESLKVGRSTLKRICRDFGIKRWPSHKRKKDSHIHSSLRLPTASVEEVIQEPDKECYQNISAVVKEVTVSVPTSEDKIDKYKSMIVKATYGEDKVVFPLHSNSIEYLSHKIAKKFKLEVESFTIKYEDEDGDWIMIPCDEDLHFRIETLKSLGQSKIKLSVVSITL
ncbi:hypothetical protein ACH5RR_041747 [Cinchona calisaya]|uniref:NIN-like protein n=1 Tax=Cinchona calisaya TaxID=153742 RepID=A0ABD2XZU9_9GENT